jgi:hypothetical protein
MEFSKQLTKEFKIIWEEHLNPNFISMEELIEYYDKYHYNNDEMNCRLEYSLDDKYYYEVNIKFYILDDTYCYDLILKNDELFNKFNKFKNFNDLNLLNEIKLEINKLFSVDKILIKRDRIIFQDKSNYYQFQLIVKEGYPIEIFEIQIELDLI